MVGAFGLVHAVNYRELLASDIETTLRLMREMQNDDPWSVPFEESVVRGSVQAMIDNPNLGRAWLICDAERPIGYIVLCFDYSLEYGGKGAWVDEFFIEKAYRGRGIGGDALRFAEEMARRERARCLHLEVSRDNPAISLYRRHGFQDHERYLMTKWL